MSTTADVATLGEAGFESPEAMAHDLILVFGHEGALDRMAHTVGGIRAVHTHAPITIEELEIACRVPPEDVEETIAFHEAIALAIRDLAGDIPLPSRAALAVRYPIKTPQQVAVELVFDHGRAGALSRVAEAVALLRRAHAQEPETDLERFVARVFHETRIPAEVFRCEAIAAAIRGDADGVSEEQGALGDPQ